MKEKAYIDHTGKLVNPVEAFRKRYEIEYLYKAESYIKGLAWGEAGKKYAIKLDTEYGLYNLYMEKREVLKNIFFSLNGLQKEFKLSVKIVDANKEHGFKNIKQANIWARKNIKGSFCNVNIGRNAIDKFLSDSSIQKSTNMDVHLSALVVLPDLLYNSYDAEQHPDYTKNENKERLITNGINKQIIIHRLYSALRIEDNIYRVKITVKEDLSANKKTSHSYEVQEISIFAGQSGRDLPAPAISNNEIPIAILLKNVEKSYEKGVFLLDASKNQQNLQGTEAKFKVGDIKAIKQGSEYKTCIITSVHSNNVNYSAVIFDENGVKKGTTVEAENIIEPFYKQFTLENPPKFEIGEKVILKDDGNEYPITGINIYNYGSITVKPDAIRYVKSAWGRKAMQYYKVSVEYECEIKTSRFTTFSVKESSLSKVNQQEKTTSKTFSFATYIAHQYEKGEQLDWKMAQKIAKDFKIETDTEIMQACELGVVLEARRIAQNGNSLRQQYEEMKDIYERQVTIRPIDTKSKVLNQYSTPCPLAYLLGKFVLPLNYDYKWGYFLEPSAGNGLLTIALPKERTVVNELDEIRVENLKQQGFMKVLNLDASKEIQSKDVFAGVITNPPFAKLDNKDKIERNGWEINTLDYKMAVLALDKMQDDGRASIIVGGKMWNAYWKPLSDTSQKQVLFGQWKTFLGYLYAQYNVVDVVYVNGDNIYRKQGTQYPIAIILIDGRHKYSEDNKPRYVFDPEKDVIIDTYDQLFERIAPYLQNEVIEPGNDKEKRAKALMLKMKMAKAKIK